MSKAPEPPRRQFHLEAARAKGPELTPFDEMILGGGAVQVRIPLRDVDQARRDLRLLMTACERSLWHLDQTPRIGLRGALFNVRATVRSAAIVIGKVKRAD